MGAASACLRQKAAEVLDRLAGLPATDVHCFGHRCRPVGRGGQLSVKSCQLLLLVRILRVQRCKLNSHLGGVHGCEATGFFNYAALYHLSGVVRWL